MAAKKHDLDWYFDNAAFYHIIYNLNDFKDPSTLTKYCHPKNNIILADASIILPYRIDTINLRFCIKGITEKILLSGVLYYSKLDTKLVSLEMLDRKSLSYSLYKSLLEVQDKGISIIISHLTSHTMYKVKLDFPINSL